MKADDLIRGKIYRMCAGDFAEFSRIGSTGFAIFHPSGEPDMQSSFAIDPSKVNREATEQESKQCRDDAGFRFNDDGD